MSGGTPADDESDPADPPAPSDAFQALGGEPRTSVVRTLAADAPCSFSALHEASGVDTSAGFAYHLRQLDDQFVRQRPDDRYELTAAGRAAARAIRSGTYTDSVDRDPVALPEPCPFCEQSELHARVTDNVTEVACDACGAPVLELSLPPSGYDTRDADSLPDALDAYHRRRIGTFADGVCPDCGGAATQRIETLAPADVPGAAFDADAGDDRSGTDAAGDHPGDATDAASDADDRRVCTVFVCDGCGTDLRCPVALTLLEHPAVVAFYHDHGEDVRERPIWNVGPEWGEWLLSREPRCAIVATELEGERLELYVARDGRVVDTRRTNADDDDGSSSPADSGPSAGGADDSGDASARADPGATEDGSAVEDHAGGEGTPA